MQDAPFEEIIMPQPEHYENLVSSGNGGKFLACHMARSGLRTAVVERRWSGGSCPNIGKNEIWSAKAADLARHGWRFGVPIFSGVSK